MKKSVAGQKVGIQMVSATDGTDFTGTVTVYITGDAGTQTIGSVGSGVCAHEGRGLHTYAPSQAETNFDHIAFTFQGTGALTSTLQVYPSFPQTGDVYPLVDTEIASVLAAVDTEVGAIKTVTDQFVFTTANRVNSQVFGIQAGVIAAATFAANALDAVWSTATRLLTAGTNIVLAKGTGVTGFNDLSAAQVNTEADTALTDYDGPTNAELATALGTADDAVLVAIAAQNNLSQANIRTAVGLASANLDTQLDALPTANENATAVLDLAAGVETGLTLRQALRLLVAAEAGKLSGAATTTIVIRNFGDSKDRITATVDASGNRSAIATDLT